MINQQLHGSQTGLSRLKQIATLLVFFVVMLAISSGCSKQKSEPVQSLATQEKEKDRETAMTKQKSEPVQSLATDSWEYKLATLNAGIPIEENDPTVNEFRILLDSIEGKTKNSREQISDMIVKAQEILKNKSINMKLLDLAHDLDSSMPDSAIDLNFAEISAAYLTLRTN